MVNRSFGVSSCVHSNDPSENVVSSNILGQHKRLTNTILEKLLVFANLIFGSYIYNLLKFGVHTIRLFRNKDFSIVQCGHIENSIFGYLIKRLFKIPYVIHVHGKEAISRTSHDFSIIM